VTEVTLGGYFSAHERAPAFGGSDGAAYSVAMWIDDEPDARGRYGGALLFIRWTPSGDTTAGHLESEYLAWGRTPDEARDRLGALSLYDVKAHLDQLIARGRPEDF